MGPLRRRSFAVPTTPLRGVRDRLRRLVPSGPVTPIRAAVLSALWPGLAHLALGLRRAAAVYAAPIGVAVLVLVLGLLAGPQALALRLVDPAVAATVLVAVILLGAWRLVAMADGFRRTGGLFTVRQRPGQAFVALAMAVILVHGVAAYYAWSFYDFGSRAFVGDRPTPTPGPSGSTPAPTDDFVAEPIETPPTKEARINILLTGIDSSEIRTHALTDTLIVASLDPATGAVSMVSFPRDIARFPLWDGRTFTGKINSLMSWANRHPDEFPDGGLVTLIRALGHLLGVPIHYYAAVNLDGFVTMVDAVGGVTVVNPQAINDPSYGGWTDGRVGFRLTAGEHTLDGQTALAFARSRKGAGDNDFTRARRQQLLLVALQRKVSDPAMLPRIPALLDAAADTVRTNFPPDRLNEMLALGRGVNDETIHRVVLGPPYAVHPPTNTTGGVYILQLDMDKLAKLSVDLYGADSAYAAIIGLPTPTPTVTPVGGAVPTLRPSPS